MPSRCRWRECLRGCSPAEHLAAIALQTGRPKDKARLLQFVESGVIEADHFQAILARHGLDNQWREFERTFLTGAK